ncbi:MAG: hypothetical protein CM15mP126_3930 [Gammaproteobacteria bacterium]|nr:MAG: hypothetical protein CM15mP126_3930 [Gammaproteobacteria bacterium]
MAIYVDDAPVTAIGDNLDVHIYDIDRIEVLTGPKVIVGAASQAGNLRIITKNLSMSLMPELIWVLNLQVVDQVVIY